MKLVSHPKFSSYSFSSDGRCFGPRGELFGHVARTGYRQMTLFHQSKVHKVHLQVLMLETFEGERPSGKQACHNDGDKLNNHIDNLRWDTCSANNRDKITHGTIARGAAHGMARLTEDVVRMIRKSEKSDCELGRQLGVSSGTVRHARTGLTWKWVD